MAVLVFGRALDRSVGADADVFAECMQFYGGQLPKGAYGERNGWTPSLVEGDEDVIAST